MTSKINPFFISGEELQIDSNPQDVRALERIGAAIAVIKTEVGFAVFAGLEWNLDGHTKGMASPSSQPLKGIGDTALIQERIPELEVLLEGVFEANTDLVLGECVGDEGTHRRKTLVGTKVYVVAHAHAQYGRHFKLCGGTAGHGGELFLPVCPEGEAIAAVAHGRTDVPKRDAQLELVLVEGVLTEARAVLHASVEAHSGGANIIDGFMYDFQGGTDENVVGELLAEAQAHVHESRAECAQVSIGVVFGGDDEITQVEGGNVEADDTSAFQCLGDTEAVDVDVSSDQIASMGEYQLGAAGCCQACGVVDHTLDAIGATDVDPVQARASPP